MNRLFVASLKYDVTEDDLSAIFSEIGPLKECVIIKDKYSGNSKGWGFVEFQSPLDAETALQRLDESEVKGRRIVVREATKPRRKENESRT